MTKKMRATRFAAAILAVLACAPFNAAEAYRDDLNHYILGCGDICPNFVGPGATVTGDPTSATGTSIGSPGAVTTDTHGNVFFASPGVVFKLDASGHLTRIAGNGTAGYSGDGGAARDAVLNNMPYYDYLEARYDGIDYGALVGGLAVDAAGNLYIADTYNNSVRMVDASGIIRTVVVADTDLGDFPTSTAKSGPAYILARWPQGVAVDPSGALYVVSAYGTLSKILPDSAVANLTGANCGANFLGTGVCAPEGIALDAKGNVYVADGFCRVRKVAADGTTVTVAGDDTDAGSRGSVVTCGHSKETGPATKAALAWPYGVAIDRNGDLIIADTSNHCIRRVDAAGNISTVAGTCQIPGYFGDGGPATSALLHYPYGVAADASGNMFIADSANDRIRKVDPAGIITTVAGSGLPPPPPPNIDSTFTGSWYDPAQSGQGLSIEILPNKHVLAFWFGFAPDGTQQTWLVGNGTYDSNRAEIDYVVIPAGGQWIPNFDPLQVVNRLWGRLILTFQDRDHGVVDFFSTLGYGTGTMNLARLTNPIGQVTGTWYDPAQNGHGIVLEALPGNQLLAEWYAFNPAGTQQAWFTGTGSFDGKTATISAIQPTGGRWIPNFDSTKIVNNPWGTLKFTFTDCNHGSVDFNSINGYGTGSMNLTRLTRPAGFSCP